jgi:hypothetical protein
MFVLLKLTYHHRWPYSKKMKAGSKSFRSIFLGWCILIGSVGLVQAQGYWLPIYGDAGTVDSIYTTNGVTHVEYTWYLAGCQQVSSIGPVMRNGNVFTYDFSIEGEYGPVLCPQFIASMHTDVVLEMLAPGNYTLNTTSWYQPFGSTNFTICPMLQPIGCDTNGFFQTQISSGITNVNYILECSSNLLDWIDLATNSVLTNCTGMPLTDPSTNLPPDCRYYRVKCQ